MKGLYLDSRIFCIFVGVVCSMKNVNPHDKFFKETFSKKEEAIDLISHTFPEKLVENLDLSSLTLDNTSYIDEDLSENFSDLVYNCLYKGKTSLKISLLFEHKSYQVDYPHLQLIKYMLKIWESRIKQKKQLMPVIPVVFYHGKQKWVYKQFGEYFEDTDDFLKKSVPDFEYLLTDLSTYSEKEIERLFRLVSVRLSMLLMKNIYDDTLPEKLFNIFVDIDHILGSEEGEKFLIAAILYLLYSFEIDKNKLFDTLNTISVKGGNIAMTTATKLLKEGEEKGLEKGSEKADSRTVIRLFTISKFSIDEIVDIIERDRAFVENALRVHGLIK